MIENSKKVIMIITILVFIIGDPTPADAKAFGWEITSQGAVSKNGCLYHVYTETYYFFGIAISTHTTEDLVGCDNTPPEPCYDGECIDANS